MCGIAGFVAESQFDGKAMIASLRHRGPDAAGWYDEVLHGMSVWLGHARLSIIDLSAAGNQPMVSDDGHTVLVFNGEIYNYRELRDAHLDGVALRSRSDTEIVLRLYEKLGIRCLDELNGDFAMAILDRRRSKLLLVRDRLGVKPVYFSESGRGLLFASEIKALIAGGVRPQLDETGLQSFFVFKYTPASGTLFKGVHRLPPGHYLEYDLGTRARSISRYWDPGFERQSTLDYHDARTELRRLVEDAIRLRLVADVPVGSFLSGGVDSSIIAGVLRHHGDITHYCAKQSDSAVREEGTVSDFVYAQRLANQWGLHLEAVDIGDSSVTREQIRTTTFYGDDLIADAAQVPCFLITRGAAGSSKVFLSGMGADEILLGYAGHQLALLWTYLEKIPFHRTGLHALSGIDQGRGAFKAFRRYLYRLGKYANCPSTRFGIFSIVGDFENSAGVVSGDREWLDGYLEQYFPEGEDPFQCLKRFEFDNFLQKNLSYVDKMSMANSVEVRVPYLDHRVVEFAYSLPRLYKLGPMGRTKRILTDAFADLLPKYIVRRRKAGFGMPIRSTFASRERVYELLDLDALAGIGPFNIKHVRRLIDSHATGREDNSSIIYAILSFQEWHSTYFH